MKVAKTGFRGCGFEGASTGPAERVAREASCRNPLCAGRQRTVASVHRRTDKIALGIDRVLGASARGGNTKRSMAMMGITVTKKVAAVALLCAVVALVACRREEYRPLKLGGPVAEQPAR